MRNISFVFVLLSLTTTLAAAQATGTASFNAPYRAFERHEFGGTLSFNSGDVTGVEGQYRFGYKAVDVGARGGMLFGSADDAVVLGIEGRGRVIGQSESFPLDGAIVAGVGMLINNGTAWNAPLGLSVGRRIDLENSDVSIIPYAQPTVNLVFGTGTGTEVGFGAGFGLDARLSRYFDVRVSAGLGTTWAIEGFAVSAVWIR